MKSCANQWVILGNKMIFLRREGTGQSKNVFPAFLTMGGLFHNFPDKIKMTVWPLSEIKESNFKHQGINSTPLRTS